MDHLSEMFDLWDQMVSEHLKKKNVWKKSIYLTFTLECLKKKIKNEKNKFNVKKSLISLPGKESVTYRRVDDVASPFPKTQVYKPASVFVTDK